MKTVAYYILHYGREWLNWSIRSIYDQVDEIHLFYTPSPSHGHGTNVPCPETRKMIRNSSLYLVEGAYSKVHWHDTSGFPHEGMHRHYAVNVCLEFGADIILVVDADELWDANVLERTLNFVKNDQQYSADYRVSMRHFWRSLQWVCDDAAMPTRILKNKKTGESNIGYVPSSLGKVFHMGYAQTPNIIEYKQKIHGHKAEWRQGWFENIFMPWSPTNAFGDVHPTNELYWYPKLLELGDADAVDRLCYDHPFYHTELIENGSF